MVFKLWSADTWDLCQVNKRLLTGISFGKCHESSNFKVLNNISLNSWGWVGVSVLEELNARIDGRRSGFIFNCTADKK